MGVGEPTITHPTTTLEELFMNIVREKTARRRFVYQQRYLTFRGTGFQRPCLNSD